MLRAFAVTLCALILPPSLAHAQSHPEDTLLVDGHYLRARPFIQAALARNPNDAHALADLSVLQWSFARYDEAVATAEKAVAAAPGSGEAHTQLTNALGAKLVASTAGTFEKTSLARRFRKEAELSVNSDPNFPTYIDALEDLARFYHEAPGLLGGDNGKARQLAERVTQIDPARGAALKVGFLPQSAKAEAIALWRAAVAGAPNSPGAHTGLGAALFAFDNNPAAAEPELTRAIALKPSLVAPYRELASLYASAGNAVALEALLKQSRAAVSDDLSPFYQAAKTLLAANKELPRAEQYLRAYLAQPAEGEEPSLAAAHWRLALALEKEGRKPEAVQELQAALREDPTLDAARKDLKRLS